jgi:hypothetical protein
MLTIIKHPTNMENIQTTLSARTIDSDDNISEHSTNNQQQQQWPESIRMTVIGEVLAICMMWHVIPLVILAAVVTLREHASMIPETLRVVVCITIVYSIWYMSSDYDWNKVIPSIIYLIITELSIIQSRVKWPAQFLRLLNRNNINENEHHKPSSTELSTPVLPFVFESLGNAVSSTTSS